MKRGVDYIGVAAGAMIFNSQGKIFMNKRGPKSRNEVGKWDFPGGAVEFNEKFEDAVKREVKEEFDMEVEIIQMLHLEEHILLEENQHWVSPTFLARHIGADPKIMEPDKCSEVGWFDFDEIASMDITLYSKLDYDFYIKKFGKNPPN